jgi:GAF domain-containing protein
MMEEATRRARDHSPNSYEGEQLRMLDRAAVHLSFLSEVSRRLSLALTDRECFQQLLNLIVPMIADWATLSLINENGELRRAVVAHADPEKRKVLEALGSNYPPSMNDPGGPGYVVASGRSYYVPDFGQNFEQNVKLSTHPEIVALLRTLGVVSAISVPIRAHEQTLGALWLATSDSGRHFDEEDLRLAQEVGSRAAGAAYNIIRYETTSHTLERLQVQHDVREEYLSQLRHDVLSTLTSATLSAEMIAKKGDPSDSLLAQRIMGSIHRAGEMLRKA